MQGYGAPMGGVRSIVAATLLLAAVVAAGCGGSSSGGTPTLNLWVFNEPSGAFTDAIANCNKQSHGAYKIVFNALSNNADAQRQALVRRLAAKDSSIDLMGMDVIWTAEFADAGWIKPFPARYADQIKRGTLAGPLKTATWQGKLYAAPANTNTQLLWYRKDIVKNPPKTWDGLISAAEKIGGKLGHVEIQGAQYEGVTVWFNSLVAGAGGTILGPSGRTVTVGPTAKRAAQIMSRLAHSSAADPSLASQKEDQNRLAFEQGSAAFEVNYPFIYPSAKADDPKLFKKIGWAPYPRTDPNKPERAPVGGINWGVGGYTQHPNQAFAAAACMRNLQNQRIAALKGGLPPTLAKLYDTPGFVKSYPFAALIRHEVNTGAVRPKSPAYADVSLAIAKTVSPPSSINVKSVVSDLRSLIKDALNSQALL